MAQILRDDQVRGQCLQHLGIHRVQTFAAVHILADQPVNFSGRSTVWQARMNYYALRLCLRRKVALMANAHDFAL